MALRRSRAEWEELVREVDRGGTIADVARRHGVRPRTLAWWRWTLRRGTVARSATRKQRAVAMVPVRVRGESPTVERVADAIEIAVRGVVVRIRVGQDTDYVARLVAAFAARC